MDPYIPLFVPRLLPFHRRIVKTRRLLGTESGHIATLDCGHTLYIFGDLTQLHHDAYCDVCYRRDQQSKSNRRRAHPQPSQPS